MYNWETNATSGNITSADVTNLTLELFGVGNSLLFTDAMIVGGVAQPIGGISRDINNGDIVWNFDLDSLTLSDFDNDSFAIQDSSSGTTYNVYSGFGYAFNADYYQNGDNQEISSYFTLNQITVPQAQPVPEPVTILGTLLAGGLGFALKKKQPSNV